MTVWCEPLGVDFSAALVDGLRARMAGEPPEAMARVTLLLPTRRMARRVQERMGQAGAAILPRIALVSDLAPLVPMLHLPRPSAPLALRLNLARLVSALLARTGLAPQSAALDLAGSLTDLMREMAEEGVGADALDAIDTGGVAHHWQDSLRFLRIATGLLADAGTVLPEDVQAASLQALVTAWGRAPQGRVIVAGSTGSRAPTRALMRIVAGLPQGDVILPGLDTDMPDPAWDALDDQAQDHPQARHRAFLAEMDLTRAEVAQWSDRAPAAPARNRLISLALRPPPATDAWLAEGPALAAEAGAACAGLTLVEAANPLEEAQAIAMRLRQAVEDGTRAALISPDRTLSREVAACLDRWGIGPDDSAGRPLDLSPPGRLLMQVARLRGQPLDGEALVALLKHPLVHSGGDRRAHLRRTRIAEVDWLRGGPLHPDPATLGDWLVRKHTKAIDDAWTDWLRGLLTRLADQVGTAPLTDHVAQHRALLTYLAQGSAPDDPAADGGLWDEAAGRAARDVFDALDRGAPAGGDLALSAADYARFVQSLLAAEQVRSPDAPNPDVMIWGALEARVQGADLVILGGLNDGTWPALPGPDMWLSRQMRAVAGLRAPERAVGLSAHDFQQAAAGAEVWLTRALRGVDAQTVPSRWLNRLTNLLAGIGPEGQAALAAMRARGTTALALARALDQPQARHKATPAQRPAPIPPAKARPTELSVTGIETLIRDPYAIYASRILRLRPLDPLRPPSDAALRGLAVHEALAKAGARATDPQALLTLLRDTMEGQVASPAQRTLWLGRFARIADAFASEEAARRQQGTPTIVEDKARWPVPGTDFTLIARADRIDTRPGGAAIYDYKTGKPPTPKQQDYYAKQLVLEALMVEGGAFPDLGAMPVQEVAYLGVGGQEGKLQTLSVQMTDEVRGTALKGLQTLIARYTADAPFPARLAPEFLSYEGDYDHLARYGEWDDTQSYAPLAVG